MSIRIDEKGKVVFGAAVVQIVTSSAMVRAIAKDHITEEAIMASVEAYGPS